MRQAADGCSKRVDVDVCVACNISHWKTKKHLMHCRFGSLPAAAQEEESKKVSLPLDEYIAAHLAPAAGAKKRKPRPRKVNGIFAMDLQAALLRPG